MSASARERVGRRPLVRLLRDPVAPPLGAIFGGDRRRRGGIAVALLHLDRLPVVVCVFKGLTGLPCPTCGSTRALGRLFAFDLAGALAMNPLATLGAALVAVWALVDLVLLPRRRALSLEVDPRLAGAPAGGGDRALPAQLGVPARRRGR